MSIQTQPSDIIQQGALVSTESLHPKPTYTFFDFGTRPPANKGSGSLHDNLQNPRIIYRTVQNTMYSSLYKNQGAIQTQHTRFYTERLHS